MTQPRYICKPCHTRMFLSCSVPEHAAPHLKKACESCGEERTLVDSSKCPGEAVDHPAHYGGGQNPYEVIKVIDAWGLGFSLGNTVKYIARAGKKGDLLEDLRKARWYLDHEIKRQEREHERSRAAEQDPDRRA